MKVSFEKNYPNIAWWIENQGWVEIGYDDFSHSLLRLVDMGGVCYEIKEHESVDSALREVEIWLSDEILNRFKQEPPQRYN